MLLCSVPPALAWLQVNHTLPTHLDLWDWFIGNVSPPHQEPETEIPALW